MTWRLCTISESSPHNWLLAKEHGRWGIPVRPHKVSPDRALKGDRLLFWLAGSGYVGYATVTENARPPEDRSEVPWAGGLYAWGLIVPMKLDFECPKPVKIGFQNMRQNETGISQFSFRRGFIAIPDEAAEAALKAIHRSPQTA